MQTTASQIMSRTQAQLEHEGIPIMLQWHDAFIWECPESEADRTARVTKEIMEQPFDELGCNFPTDVTVGYNLGDYHNTKNTAGQKSWN